MTYSILTKLIDITKTKNKNISPQLTYSVGLLKTNAPQRLRETKCKNLLFLEDFPFVRLCLSSDQQNIRILYMDTTIYF